MKPTSKTNQMPSRPAADPHSNHPHCAGRESKFRAVKQEKTTRLAAALLAAFTLATQIPASASPTNYTILDSYTNGVPTGTSYQPLTSYNQYVDAGSVDASPFVLTKTTGNSGGILFYGSTELISGANANTFRLTSGTGAFDFNSFNLQNLEQNGSSNSNAIPSLTITSSTGATQTWSSTYEEFFPGFGMFSFNDSGVKTMNWSGVNWVDITTQYTKAKTSDFVLTEGQTVPEPSSALLILSGMCAFLMRRRSV